MSTAPGGSTAPSRRGSIVVISLDPASSRWRRTSRHLADVGFSACFQQAVTAADASHLTSSTRSPGEAALVASWARIAAGPPALARDPDLGDWMLIAEDDLRMFRGAPALVRPLLASAPSSVEVVQLGHECPASWLPRRSTAGNVRRRVLSRETLPSLLFRCGLVQRRLLDGGRYQTHLVAVRRAALARLVDDVVATGVPLDVALVRLGEQRPGRIAHPAFSLGYQARNVSSIQARRDRPLQEAP